MRAGLSKLNFRLQALAAEAGRLLCHSVNDRDEAVEQWLTAGPVRGCVQDGVGTSEWAKPVVEAEERMAAWPSPSVNDQ